MKKRFNEVKKFIHRHKNQYIADLGIGKGYYWRYEDVEKVFGVDLNEKNLEKLTSHTPDLLTFLTDVKDTGLPSKKFDLVIISQVLEHIKDYQNVLKEAKRIIKDDGYFFIGMPIEDYHKLHYYSLWTLDDVIQLSESLGDLIELNKWDDYWHLYIKNESKKTIS